MAVENGYNMADLDINTIIDAIYYIGTKNPNEERMSLHDFASLATKFSNDSTLSANFGKQQDSSELQYLNILVSLTDTCLINSELTTDEISDIIGIDKELISLICPENQKTSIREIIKSSKELLNTSMIHTLATVKTPEPQHIE